MSYFIIYVSYICRVHLHSRSVSFPSTSSNRTYVIRICSHARTLQMACTHVASIYSSHEKLHAFVRTKILGVHADTCRSRQCLIGVHMFLMQQLQI